MIFCPLPGELARMRSSAHASMAFALSIVFISTALSVSASDCGSQNPCEEAEIKAPSPEDYREEYDRDATNQKKQTWTQYWGWVKSFHEGSFFVSGWTDRAKNLVVGVKAGP